MKKYLDSIIEENDPEVVVAFQNGHQFPGQLGRVGDLYRIRSQGRRADSNSLVHQDVVFAADSVAFVARQSVPAEESKGNGQSRIHLPGGN